MARTTTPKVSEAVKSGDRKLALEAMRDRLAVDIDKSDTEVRDRVALTKQLQLILNELEEYAEPDTATVTPLERIRAQRGA